MVQVDWREYFMIEDKDSVIWPRWPLFFICETRQREYEDDTGWIGLLFAESELWDRMAVSSAYK